MAEDQQAAASHVLMFPFPAQGHVPPMLNLAELISGAGLFVTFLNTEHAHARFLRHSPALITRLARLPKFRFQTIPDGLPVDDPRPFHRLLDIEQSMRTRSKEAYRELLRSMTGRAYRDAWPPLTCVVADGVLPMALDVAEEFEIPVMLLRTSSACSLWAYCCIPQLIESGEVPLPQGADLDKVIEEMAGMDGLLRRRDLPSLICDAKSTNDRGLQFANTISANLGRARALILNTFESLESAVLSEIRSICPTTYTIGPIHLLLRNANTGPPSSSGSASLWPEDRACMAWLDAQPSKSVVYVSFGSSLVMTKAELIELSHGIFNSGHRFLWVVRADLIEECDGANMMIDLEVGKRGCLVSWAPQEEVLAHPAVGCFLTHSGWNSTLESMAEGVPMICRPFFVDQPINSRFVGEVWKIGVDMKGTCVRDVVERMVEEVMEGEKADELRRSAGEMAIAVVRSVEEHGTSYANLQRLIECIKSFALQPPRWIEKKE